MIPREIVCLPDAVHDEAIVHLYFLKHRKLSCEEDYKVPLSHLSGDLEEPFPAMRLKVTSDNNLERVAKR